jgi:hypothetical protein
MLRAPTSDVIVPSYMSGRLQCNLNFNIALTIQSVPEGKTSILGGHSISNSKQNSVYTYMSPTPKGFRDRAITLYNSKIVDKKEILRTVSGYKIGTVYLAQYIFQNSTIYMNALCNSCQDMACCSSVHCTVYCTVK